MDDRTRPENSGALGGGEVDVLVVDDSAGDVRLAIEALNESKMVKNVFTVSDGVEAMAFLRRRGKYASCPRPDLVLLDLNMPRKDGREVLAEVKQDPDLRSIPVVVLTISSVEEDVTKAYKLYANSYIVKPIDMDRFVRAVSIINDFWFGTAKLPPK